MEDINLTMKFIVVGNGRIGKTSLICRFVKGTYSDEYKKTLGVAFLEKYEYVKHVDTDVNYLIWDTAGQEEYDQLTKEYYKGSSACLVAFSQTDKASFQAVEKWRQKVVEQCGYIPMALVQTKIDLTNESVINYDEVQKLSFKLNLPVFRISTKQNQNINEPFEYLVKQFVNLSKNQQMVSSNPIITLGEIKNNRSQQFQLKKNLSQNKEQQQDQQEIQLKSNNKEKKQCLIF